MRIDLLTLFPAMLEPVLSASILGRARAAGRVEFVVTDIRDHAEGPHRKADDRPFGGGPGMVLMCGPVFAAVRAVEAADPRPSVRLVMSPAGERLTQDLVRELAVVPRLMILAGHYEGLDERIITGLGFREVSIGDYVLTGGELPALVVADAVTRLQAGVLGNADGPVEESFGAEGLLEHPQYTRPREFEGLAAPEWLFSGDHGAIADRRREESVERTRQRRPDLWLAWRSRQEQAERDAEAARAEQKAERAARRAARPAAGTGAGNDASTRAAALPGAGGRLVRRARVLAEPGAPPHRPAEPEPVERPVAAPDETPAPNETPVPTDGSDGFGAGLD